ncbi:hypothetical protein M9458_016726, partial [Cirrhinus mrigala]
VKLDVVVPCALHPQRLHGARTSLVDGQAVGEIDHFVFCAVDDQDWRRHF